MKRKCIFCSSVLESRYKIKFCSNKCQANFRYERFVSNWRGSTNTFIHSKNVPKFIRRYLIEKNNARCSDCGWNKTHPITGKIPLEIDHIDGDSKNNSETNLRVLCPNCHSLTSNFRNLNRGSGRSWRSRK